MGIVTLRGMGRSSSLNDSCNFKDERRSPVVLIFGILNGELRGTTMFSSCEESLYNLCNIRNFTCRALRGSEKYSACFTKT